MPQIDQIAVMREYVRGRNAGRGKPFAKELDARFGERFRFPLALILGEKGERLSPDSAGVQRSIFHTASGAHMGADAFHGVSTRVVPAERFLQKRSAGTTHFSAPLFPYSDV